jgi:hypothetical protein
LQVGRGDFGFDLKLRVATDGARMNTDGKEVAVARKTGAGLEKYETRNPKSEN